ncbi:hypothetical protein ICN84_07875 [Akkermansia glycaniphila]|uniref:hypothetical protein n=1 Tax=Akkermansia glycaniphila TaxID=1679444 RepID=UPI001C00DF76|nr:hypothetical protein [Akkermansia glycaniphila]MBT9449991.1 hypothetical protein [Akkermansia glycaniphila]
MTIPTTPGKTYCVTTSTGCNIYYTGSSGLDTTLLTMTSEGQGYFTAPGLKIECTDEHASVTECFNAAPAGVSSGGGEVKPGLAYKSGMPAETELKPDTVYDIGIPSAVCNLSSYYMAFSGRVVTCEIWLRRDAGGAPTITFPASWQWLGGLPDLPKASTSYCIVVRCTPGGTIANLAYSV